MHFPILFSLFLSWPNLTWDKSVPLATTHQLQKEHSAFDAHSALRIFWWNIHDGEANLALPRSYTLSKNVRALIDSNLAPDFMAFAEYGEEAFQSTDLAQLNSLYPHQLFVRYDEKKDYGVMLYSKDAFEAQPIEPLDYTPSNLTTASAQNAYRKKWCGGQNHCDRPLIILKMKHLYEGKEQEFTLVPTHLFDCWRAFEKLHTRGTSKLDRLAAKEETLREILTGTHNPLWFQIENYKRKVREKTATPLFPAGMVLFGDFNTPNSFDHIYTPTLAFQTLESGLKNAITENEPSFPSNDSVEAKHFLDAQIDHAFVSPNTPVGFAAVLPLAGSDHYPLYLTLPLTPSH